MINENTRFLKILSEYQNINSKQNNKIGTLSEKNIHILLKRFIIEDESFHEIKIGSYYVDVLIDDHIYEIQTANFNKLRNKLEFLLQNYKVTIIYPFPHIKYIEWINPETGEITDKRKSPKVGSIFDAFYELYKIKFYLNNPNLEIKVFLIDLLETRNLNGWDKNKKRGSTREERYPISLDNIITLNNNDNYKSYLDIFPILPENFTVEDLKKKTKLTLYKTRFILNIYSYLNLIKVIGKDGKKNLYKIL